MTVIRLSSFLTALYSLSVLLPFLIGMYQQEQGAFAFFDTFIIALALGLGGLKLSQNARHHPLHTRDGFLVAVLFWLIFSALSALPFMLDQRLKLSFTDALFEGVSGITTTGASVLDNIDQLPMSILFYRAQLNFLGGLGIIVLALAIMPLLGVGGTKLYQSEMPGPFKEEKLTPRLADTAKQLWLIYCALAGLCTLSFWLAGMPFFDAICHALSTVSLGGFSTHGASLGFYHSDAIEAVATLFSILAAVNFALYFSVLNRRSLKPLWKNAELRFFIGVLAFVCLITVIELYRDSPFTLWQSIVHGLFQATSVMTDNGLGAANYPDWPPQIVLLLLGASFFGGCIGSTCGGIKAMRFLILFRHSQTETRQMIHPNAVLKPKIGQHPVGDRELRSVWALFFVFSSVSFLFIFALVACGEDPMTAFGTVAACINNMGLGYGHTAAGFGTLTEPEKWLMCGAMLLGRLEIFPVLIIGSKTFWEY